MGKGREFYTPQEVGNMTGFSASFIVSEIKAGALAATLVKPPGRTRGRWRIAVIEAHRYAHTLGLPQPTQRRERKEQATS